MENIKDFLKSRISAEHFDKLIAVDNDAMFEFVANAIELCNPDKVYVADDSQADIDYIRQRSITEGAETPLNIEGHTSHFDNAKDQARDPSNTKYLLPKGVDLGERLSSMDKEEGLTEVRGFFKDSMIGREMLVCFFCLGPVNSDFSIPCVQVTDSAYVAHSEAILYRPGYEQFKKAGTGINDFFRFLHTQGKLENAVSVELDKRRIYMDLLENTVYSTNTQYAGNTVGLKKLALRLAINKSDKEGWLAEHMFVMGVHGPNGRVTYFTGAFPSACGKTSTAMIPGQTIIGDDIAYFRKKDGEIKAVNVEQGIFGIIRDVNADDDPVIHNALNQPGEVIFGNVLVKDGKPYWEGMGEDLPADGTNYQGAWTIDQAEEISSSHKNARYTIRISALDNKDPQADNPQGVTVGAMVYGGRDSDTCVPVEEAFNWNEGIICKGASLESETTAAVLGAQGVRKFNLMSNMDFLSIPLGKYIQNNLDFADGIDNPPSIFSVNYFLKEDDKYLNGMLDKKVWILWAELRANGDVEALKTPTGYIPLYEDVAKLFKENLGKEYTKADYEKQFTVKIPKLLEKIDRIEKIYKETVTDTPQLVYDTFNAVRDRLNAAAADKGDNISPFDLA